MTVNGHIQLAAALTYPLVEYLLDVNSFGMNIEQLYICITLILIGSTFPDIDEPNSYIGNKLSFISYLIQAIGIKHRTLTHWLIVPLLLISGAYYISSYYLLAFALGLFLHTIGDLITNTGIRGYFFPILPNTKIVLLPEILRFDTFSITEIVINFCLFILNAYLYSTLFLRFTDDLF